VVSCLSRDYANLFHHEGSRTDKHVREHEVYSVVGGTPTARRVPETESKFSALATGSGWLGGQGPLGLRRSSLVAAPLLFLALVGTGIGARAVMGPAPAGEASAPEKPAAPAPRVTSAPAARPAAETPREAPRAPVETAKPKSTTVEKKAVAKAEKKPAKPVAVASAAQSAPAASANPARLELAISPFGEVFIDGRSRGISPPITTLEISPGSHTIEIRNSTSAHVQKVDIKPGDKVKIRHKFK